jgi:glycosyltransferase involved in cell wall biosynthesis
MRVALVHDCLGKGDDAERMLQVLHRLYPHAPVYVAFVRDRHRARSPEGGWDVRTTWAQRLPDRIRTASIYRPLLPYIWEALDLSAYDLVISLSGPDLSHAVITGAQTLHVSYCLTPPRDLWEHFSPPAANPANRSRGWGQTRLRQYDFYAAQRVDRFVTQSEGVARRIGKFYRRSAEVIPPPVAVAGAVAGTGQQYCLYVGALERSQGVDWAIAACQQLGLPLWIVGTGRDMQRLRQLAGPTVRFLGEVTATDLPAIYGDAQVLIDPCVTADFGFAVVAAMGRGIPAIACARSGLRDVILDYRTGLLFPEPTLESLCQTLQQFTALRFSASACIQRAEEFAESVFMAKFQWFVAQALDEHRQQGPWASYGHGRDRSKPGEEES